jgi:hypothetical protein
MSALPQGNMRSAAIDFHLPRQFCSKPKRGLVLCASNSTKSPEVLNQQFRKHSDLSCGVLPRRSHNEDSDFGERISIHERYQSARRQVFLDQEFRQRGYAEPSDGRRCLPLASKWTHRAATCSNSKTARCNASTATQRGRSSLNQYGFAPVGTWFNVILRGNKPQGPMSEMRHLRAC